MRLKTLAGFTIVGLLCSLGVLESVQAEILISPQADETQVYAARELQRYFHQLTGRLLSVVSSDQPGAGTEPLCLIGCPNRWSVLGQLTKDKEIPWTPALPGPQGYTLKTTLVRGRKALVIAGADSCGCLYGVYGLLQDHLGMAFYLDGDMFPSQAPAVPPVWPALGETKTPAVAIRGILPWTNFPQSPSSYSWEDWKFILDQMARMRMNFILIHNYNGQCDHNEMFHNFEVEGKLSRGWMPTARSGHAWGGMPGWEVNRYLFGAADLFDDNDFGADCALHNGRLDNEQVFRKGVCLFQRILDYAHRRGIKVGLGLDLDLIPKSYGLPASDPAVVLARVRQVADDYPDLDFLMCFQSESIAHDPVARARWHGIFSSFYDYLHQHAPLIRLAVSGWGLDPTDVMSLPPDVIAAPIAPYSARFENGSAYGTREYWGCPWMERDMRSSEYYYPYNLDLSDTIQAWAQRAPNMKGFYGLTWRLADAISPKLGFIARAPWDDRNELKDSRAVYGDFARRNYGEKAADAITSIIDQNEPFASEFGECASTPPFAETAVAGPLFNLASFRFSGKGADELKIVASDFKNQSGTQKCASASQGSCLGWIQAGDWTGYYTDSKLQFNPGWTSIEATVASAAMGGKIEIHVNAPNGPKIGEVQVPKTGDWNNWVEARGSLVPPTERKSFYLVYKGRGAEDELTKADSQLKVIDSCIGAADTAIEKYRLGLLRDRIAAERDHILLNLHFNETGWPRLSGLMQSWVGNFVRRVTDISSLGNVVSVENRFVQKNYLSRIDGLRRSLRAQPPGNLAARGTPEGAILTWTNDLPRTRGYFVYRDNRKVNQTPLSPVAKEFLDHVSGNFSYTLTALLWDDQESPPSLPSECHAGMATHPPPRIFVISPPTSALAGQPVWFKARLLDDREASLLSATLCYRIPGSVAWSRMPMKRRVKAVFTAIIPSASISPDGLEYYIEATDGEASSVFPVSAPDQPLSLTVEPEGTASFITAPNPHVGRQSHVLSWPAVPKALLYRIYRSNEPDFVPGPENFLTYVAASRNPHFEDDGEDFLAQPLEGSWCYRITGIDHVGNESMPSSIVVIAWK